MPSGRTLRVCWLIDNDRSGGVASVARACCHAAAAHGHDATLLICRPLSGWYRDDQQYRLRSLDARTDGSDTPLRLRDWLRANPMDVLVLNDSPQAEHAISFLAPTPRLVYAVHDTAAMYWKTAVQHEPDLDAIVAVSETVVSHFKHKLSDRGKCTVIHNGCDYPAEPGADHPRSGDLVFLGGGELVKGGVDVLHLWQELNRDKPFDGQLHWFGDLDPWLHRRADRLPQRQNVHLYGRSPRDAIYDTLGRSKVLLMLSRSEGFGMATIEAMAMGCVPVAWDIASGTREIAKPGVTGLYAPLGDTRSLAARVQDALEDHERYREACIRVARNEFSASRMWTDYKELFRRLVDKPALIRSRSVDEPDLYRAPRRFFGALPEPVRHFARTLARISPRLGYLVRDMRGY